MPKFLAYGTLRKGSYNYERCKQLFEDGYNVLDTVTLNVPYVLVNTNNVYPFLIPNTEMTDVVFDVVECSDEAWQFIEQMERNAGYYTGQCEGLNVFYRSLNIFPAGTIPTRYIIKSGDWLQHEKELIKNQK